MSPTVDVEIRRNRHGSVLAYADRDRAARLLEDHRGVLTSLYRLVDRRHGADGEIVARLAIRDGERAVDELHVAGEYRRDLEADRALSVADDVRHHAESPELVTDGGVSLRAVCSECSWSGDASTLTGVAREVEAHRQETGHDAKAERVVTDGGRDQDDGGGHQVNVEKHKRELPDAYCHSDLAEHVSWMLGEAVDPVDYPHTVTVTIEVQHDGE